MTVCDNDVAGLARPDQPDSRTIYDTDGFVREEGNIYKTVRVDKEAVNG